MILAALAVSRLPRISQDPAYHRFADSRTFLEVPHFLNVISSLPLAVVGLLGLYGLARKRNPVQGGPPWDHPEKWPLWGLFFGVAATGLGSAVYHWDPGNTGLVLDRLPMTIAFVSFFAMVISERIKVRAGFLAMFPLLFVGFGSVLYWHQTELAGAGDLRPYIMVQFFPMLAIPLIMFLFPWKDRERGWHIWGPLGFYGLAKITESMDAPIYEMGRIVSGHTIKHLLAAAAVYWVYSRRIHPKGFVEP